MNDLQKRWLEALLSNKYEQGIGSLRQNNKFCCLGVLCDVYDPNGWSTYCEDSHYNCSAMPSEEIIDAVEFDEYEHATYFSTLNDDKEASFAEIAQALERYFNDRILPEIF